jgi:16S rRNA (uracil1498-N3)-methyltransferase
VALKSVYLPALSALAGDDLVRVTGDEHRHLAVARAESGESVDLFDGLGTVWEARIELVGKKETLARVIGKREIARERFELILGMALIRTSAFEFAIEKVVEIGVSRIIPFIASRSNAAGPGRLDRWAKIIVEAAKQSKRFHLPVIESPIRFDQIISRDAKTKIVFAERSAGPLKSALSGSPALYLIGPEGGWTDSELEVARQNGFALATLGSGVLKAETAAIVGGTLLRYEMERTGTEY